MLRELSRQADRQIVVWYLLEGGDYQGFIESLVDPQRTPNVVLRGKIETEVQVFQNPSSVRKIDWDQWPVFISKENYPLPDPTFPKAAWYPCEWHPFAQTFNTPSKNIEPGTIYTTPEQVIWWDDTPDASIQEERTDNVIIRRDAGNQVLSVERKRV